MHGVGESVSAIAGPSHGQHMPSHLQVYRRPGLIPDQRTTRLPLHNEFLAQFSTSCSLLRMFNIIFSQRLILDDDFRDVGILLRAMLNTLHTS